MEELNAKIAEWLGFTIGEYPEPRLTPDEKAWYDPKGMFFSGLKHFMDFPNDIDACFRYIVPKLREIMSEEDFAQFITKIAVIIFVSLNPALELCRAVEKLIVERNIET